MQRTGDRANVLGTDDEGWKGKRTRSSAGGVQLGRVHQGGHRGGAKKNKPEVRISAGMQPSNRLMRREGS